MITWKNTIRNAIAHINVAEIAAEMWNMELPRGSGKIATEAASHALQVIRVRDAQLEAGRFFQQVPACRPARRYDEFDQ